MSQGEAFAVLLFSSYRHLRWGWFCLTTHTDRREDLLPSENYWQLTSVSWDLCEREDRKKAREN